MIRASVYYQKWADDLVKVWMHVGQIGEPNTVVCGPTSYTTKDFLRLKGTLPELRWEDLGERVQMRD